MTVVDEVSAPGLVLVDFWADWCVPCRQLSPVVDEVAGEFPQVRVVKVDIEAEPALVQSMGVQSVPTLVLLRDGLVVDRFGALSKSALVAKLSGHL